MECTIKAAVSPITTPTAPKPQAEPTKSIISARCLRTPLSLTNSRSWHTWRILRYRRRRIQQRTTNFGAHCRSMQWIRESRLRRTRGWWRSRTRNWCSRWRTTRGRWKRNLRQCRARWCMFTPRIRHRNYQSCRRSRMVANQCPQR